MIRGAVLTLLAIGSIAHAHDYWISSDQLIVASEGTVSASLLVGEMLRVEEERAHEMTRTVRLAVVHAGKTTDIAPLQREGARPSLSIPLTAPGGHLVVLDREPAYVTSDPETFGVYLKMEGLDRIRDERDRLGEATTDGRERYRRNLKALFQVGATRDDSFAFDAGQTLELIPEAHPAFTKAGDTIAFRATFRDEPIAGIAIDALSTSTGATTVVRNKRYVTDAEGRVVIAIDREASWVIRTVHMIRCTDCLDAEWDSFWAAYSFANTIGAAPAKIATPAPAATSSGVPWVLVVGLVLAALTPIVLLLRRRR